MIWLNRGMKRLLLLPVTALFLTSVSAFAELKWENAHVTTDAAPGEEVVTLRYPFKNEGEAPVTIKKISPVCGCTTADLEKKTYAPGEKGEIVAYFTIGKRTGTQSKRIIIRTDDGKKDTLRFTVKIP